MNRISLAIATFNEEENIDELYKRYNFQLTCGTTK